ncbi:MAG TPA: hypothetical protein VLO11_09800, partial [Luteolibacter sp.]|nr:hypothetical protein [Luteolibacter sp.]
MKPRPYFSDFRNSSKWFPAMAVCLAATLATAPAATLYWDGTDTGPDADGGAGTWIDDGGTT